MCTLELRQRNLKREKRQAERKWVISKTATEYNTFRQKFHNYSSECNKQKTLHYSNEIVKNNCDQKQLFRVVNKLTDGDKTIPYPDKPYNVLTNEFGHFFLNKVESLIESIENINTTESIESNIGYQHNTNNYPPFNNFHPLSNAEIRTIIMQSSSKCSVLASNLVHPILFWYYAPPLSLTPDLTLYFLMNIKYYCFT